MSGPLIKFILFFFCLQPFVLNYLPYTLLLVTFPQINNINTFYDKGAWRHWNSHTMLHCKHQQSCNNKSPIIVNHNISMFTFFCIKFLIKFYKFCILFFFLYNLANNLSSCNNYKCLAICFKRFFKTYMLLISVNKHYAILL